MSSAFFEKIEFKKAFFPNVRCGVLNEYWRLFGGGRDVRGYRRKGGVGWCDVGSIAHLGVSVKIKGALNLTWFIAEGIMCYVSMNEWC